MGMNTALHRPAPVLSRAMGRGWCFATRMSRTTTNSFRWVAAAVVRSSDCRVVLLDVPRDSAPWCLCPPYLNFLHRGCKFFLAPIALCQAHFYSCFHAWCLCDDPAAFLEYHLSFWAGFHTSGHCHRFPCAFSGRRSPSVSLAFTC